MSQIPMFESARSLHELYPRLLGNILDTGAAVSPRGQATYELSPMAFVLEDPTDCVRLPKARRVNQAYSIVEKLSLVHGVADPETFCFYIPSLRRLLDSEGVFGGAYGPRVARQLDYVYGVLREDPHSRRAVMTVFSSAVDHQPSNDVPCTLSLQFMMRDGLLSLFVSMRSSDVYLGLPYDVQQFTFLQQLMAHWLRVDVGSYVHFAASTCYLKSA